MKVEHSHIGKPFEKLVSRNSNEVVCQTANDRLSGSNGLEGQRTRVIKIKKKGQPYTRLLRNQAVTPNITSVEQLGSRSVNPYTAVEGTRKLMKSNWAFTTQEQMRGQPNREHNKSMEGLSAS